MALEYNLHISLTIYSKAGGALNQNSTAVTSGLHLCIQTLIGRWRVDTLSRLICELILMLQWPNIRFFALVLLYQNSINDGTTFCINSQKPPLANS